MQIVVRGKNMTVSDPLRAYVQEKISKLDRHLDSITSAVVDLSHQATRSAEARFTVQVTFHVDGTILRGEERGPDLYRAVDAVVDIMDRQIERYKGKRYGGKHRAESPRLVPSRPQEVEAPEETVDYDAVVRTKRFTMKPMTEDEAIEQMELLGHDFFVFFNSGTSDVNVLYRRGDGGYGILVPELG